MEKEVKRIKVYEEKKNTINDLSKYLSLDYMASVAAFTDFLIQQDAHFINYDLS